MIYNKLNFKQKKNESEIDDVITMLGLLENKKRSIFGPFV